MENHLVHSRVCGKRAIGLGMALGLLSSISLAGPVEDALNTARQTILNLERVSGQATPRARTTGADADLVLTPYEVFAPDSRTHVIGGDAGELKPPQTRYFTGYRVSEPGSRVFLAIRPDGSTKGYYHEADATWALQDKPDSPPGKSLAQRRLNPATEFAGRTFSCGNERHDLAAHDHSPGRAAQSARNLPNVPRATGTPYVVTVAVETDYEFRQMFADLTEAQQYIADLFAYASSIYQAELNTRLQLGAIYLYDTSADPWSATTTSTALDEVRNYWNANRSGISRATTHFLSGKNMGGGIAYVGTLCSQWGYGYGVSASLAGNFDINNPGVVWDAKVVAHEIGHNFNSDHTHCYAGIGGNANPVDACYNTESGCWAGSTSLPGINALTGGTSGWGGGTIMSYCHQLSGGYNNLTMTFGKDHPYGIGASRVPAVMREYVETTAAAAPACLQIDATPGEVSPNSLIDALDDPDLEPFTTGGAYWFSQNTVTRDGVDAAQSGAIGHNQSSTMQTAVTGPGQLSFWWRVSSEAGYDVLSFAIDGVQKAAISGTSNTSWQEVSLPVASGAHILQWKYAKDSADIAGSDAGWVDEVSFDNEPRVLSLTTSGNGAISGAIPGEYPFGSGLMLGAVPDNGHLFAGWGGDCASAGTNPLCDLTMDTDKTVSALFIPNSYGLASEIAAGDFHTCAVANGGVQCWGYNDSGQLGDGSAVDRWIPVQAIPAYGGATLVSAGGDHTCAVVSGGVQCWGGNDSGQLGVGTIEDHSTPVQAIASNSGATAVSAGNAHTCAVVQGGVQCWGSNASGQLGDGSGLDSPSPVQAIPAGSNVTAIAAGGDHTCALVNGGVQCWGRNFHGQIGDNSMDNRLAPVPVLAADAGVTHVAAGAEHSCAVVGGGVRCWGLNDNGQLGDGSVSDRLTPVQVFNAGSGVTQVAAGGMHTCAVVEGGVQCWGDNSKGQVGDGGTVDKTSPVQSIAANSGVTFAATGWDHSCAVLAGGAKCWGGNQSGKLGVGGTSDSAMPVWVFGFAPSQFSLTVNKTGSGTVTSTPAGINCGTTCSAVFGLNTSVTLTASPSAGSVFSGWSGACNGAGSCSVTLDNDKAVSASFGYAQTLQLGAATYAISESGTSLTIPVTRSGGTTGVVSVQYTTANGTATAGSDYTARSGTLTFNAGISSLNISIPIANDTVAEGNETFTVMLSNPVNAGLGANSQSTVTITDNDSGIEVVSTSLEVTETGGSIVVQVQRIGSTSGSASVGYTTANGTAQSGVDYTARSGTLNWTSGTGGIKSVSIPILNDSGAEGNETFSFNLGTVSGAVLNAAKKSTVITILDDDAGVKLGSASLNVAESAGSVSMTVNRFGNPTNAVSVNYATTNGTAGAGDYTATSGTLNWGSGETGVKILNIPITNDNATESNETFTLALSGVTGAVLASPGSATVTITDDDNSLQFSAASASATEGAASVTVSVTRVGSAGAPASVSYTTEDGSATAGQDYTAKSGTLNWTAGETASKSIVIPLLNDTQFEGNEAFSVRLSDPAGATLGANANLTVNLADNEAGFVLDKAGYSVGEGTASVVVTVKRLGPSNTSVSVKYATANGTATAGQDYTAASGTLSFSSGVTQKTVSVPILNDTLSDGGDETFTFNLSAPVGGALGTPASATVTILDNDLPPCREVGFGQAKYVVWENQGQVIIPLELGWTDGEAPTCPVNSFTLNYATTAGTALATSDFTSKSGTLSFPGTALGSSASLSIPLVNNATAEGLEHFTVKLSSPSPALGLGAIQATVAIQDDDEVFPPDGQMPAGWSVPDGFAGWGVSQDTAAAEGVYTLRNETVGDDEFAVILAEGEFAAGTVSFKVKVTSEAGFDRLRFYIDGEPKGEWSGNVTTWTLVSYPLSAGWHSLGWAYEKDGSGLVGADAAWIDSVTLPVWTPAP